MSTKDWYERTLERLGPWWANFILRRPEFENKYVILKNREAELNAIGAWIAYWTAARLGFEESSKQFTKYFSAITGNDPSVDPPLTFTVSLPPGVPPDVPPGIEFVIREIRREVVALANYAKADGEALGFEAAIAQPISPENVKPSIQLFAAAHDYEVVIVVTGRNGAKVWDVYVTRKGGVRTKYTTCEDKTAQITITPTSPGDAEQIQIDVQLRKNNANYGQPSDPAFVTVNP